MGCASPQRGRGYADHDPGRRRGPATATAETNISPSHDCRSRRFASARRLVPSFADQKSKSLALDNRAGCKGRACSDGGPLTEMSIAVLSGALRLLGIFPGPCGRAPSAFLRLLVKQIETTKNDVPVIRSCFQFYCLTKEHTRVSGLCSSACLLPSKRSIHHYVFYHLFVRI